MVSTAVALVLAGCGGSSEEQAKRRHSEAGAESLPTPQRAPSGVTGMPTLPGPGVVGPPGTAFADGMLPEDIGDDISAALAAEQAAGIDPALQPLGPDYPQGTPPQPPVMEPAAPPADEPGLPEAAAVVREYYAALGRRDFTRAYRLWSDGGAASSRSPQQFAESFSGTASWSVDVLAPERDASARSRYIEVPVAVEEVGMDGSVRRQIGAYTLRRVDADDGGVQRRTWRISSADLREVQY